MTAELCTEGPPGNLETAWQLGRLELLEQLRREPRDSEIAERVAQSGALRFIAGLHKYPTLAARIMELRRGYKPSMAPAGH